MDGHNRRKTYYYHPDWPLADELRLNQLLFKETADRLGVSHEIWSQTAGKRFGVVIDWPLPNLALIAKDPFTPPKYRFLSESFSQWKRAVSKHWFEYFRELQSNYQKQIKSAGYKHTTHRRVKGAPIEARYEWAVRSVCFDEDAKKILEYYSAEDFARWRLASDLETRLQSVRHAIAEVLVEVGIKPKK